MSIYRIYFTTGASASVEVEAEDRAEAVEKAWDDLPAGPCAQCSGWGQQWSLDVGDEWEESGDYEVDGQYIEATS